MHGIYCISNRFSFHLSNHTPPFRIPKCVPFKTTNPYTYRLTNPTTIAITIATAIGAADGLSKRTTDTTADVITAQLVTKWIANDDTNIVTNRET